MLALALLLCVFAFKSRFIFFSNAIKKLVISFFCAIFLKNAYLCSCFVACFLLWAARLCVSYFLK